LEDLTFDSLKVQLLDDGNLLDSVTMRRGRNEKYDRDFIILDNLTGNKVTRVKHIQLTAGSPIQTVDRTKVILTEDSTARTNFQLVKDTTNSQRYTLRYNWRPKRNYELTLEEGAFLGFFGDKSKSVTKSFTMDEAANFGDIILNITLPDTNQHYLVQLLNEEMDFIHRSTPISKSGKIPFRQFPGGKYTLRIVYDTNNNGEWDPGDVYEKRQPERIWLLGRTFIIRANWEQEEKITIPK